jgi:hypothetical protein
MKNIISLIALLLPLLILAQEGTVTCGKNGYASTGDGYSQRHLLINSQFRTASKLLHYSETASLL